MVVVCCGGRERRGEMRLMAFPDQRVMGRIKAIFTER